MNKSNSEKHKISVVCPVFNEEETIPLYYERFQKALACLNDRYSIELTFLNGREKLDMPFSTLVTYDSERVV